MNEKYQLIGVKVPVAIKQELLELASEQHTTLSQLVRHILCLKLESKG